MRSPKGLAALASVLLVAAALISAAAALEFPRLTGRVVDAAGVLDAATTASLNQKLADLEAKSTDQLVVATLKSLQGTSVEDFGNQLFRHWKLGQQGKNNGVLLIVAPSERKVRIEVGYGLEGTLTDAISKFITSNAIVPRFKANDIPGGITRGVDDIISVLTGDAEEWKQRAAQRPEPPSRTMDALTVMLVILIIVIVVLSMMSTWVPELRRQARMGRGGRYAPYPSDGGWSGGSSGGGSWGGGGSDGGFSGGGGSSGGGGASDSW